MIKQVDSVLEAWLARAIATGGPYDPAALFLGVGTAFTDRGALTALVDITQATGAMATRQAVTPWSAPYKMGDGRWVADGPALSFSPASADEAQTLSVWFLATLISAGALKAFGPIAPPIPLPSELYTWTIVPRLTIDPLGRFSAEVSWNG